MQRISYVYAKYVWVNLAIKPVTTADIDFGLGAGSARVYPKTIFELLSSLDYKERHPQIDIPEPIRLAHQMAGSYLRLNR